MQNGVQRRNKNGLIGLAMLTMATATASAVPGRVATHYFVTDLGGSSGDIPFAINEHGQITGGNAQTPGKPFLWSPASTHAVTGSATLIDFAFQRTTPPGPFGGGGTYTVTTGYGVGINAQGQVAISSGGLWTSTVPNTPTGAATDLYSLFNDLLALATHYGTTTNAVWQDGDFNGDGAVTFDDLLLLAKNYNAGASAADTEQLDAGFVNDFSLARSLMPEPTTLGSIALLCAIAARRNR